MLTFADPLPYSTVTMPPVASFAAKTKTVKIKDERITWFKANINHGMYWMHANEGSWYNPGDNISYFGDGHNEAQLVYKTGLHIGVPLRVYPFLLEPQPTPFA